MTRNMAIKWLKWIQNMFSQDSEQYKALQSAINSMEIDEAYQLEYEITTKNDLAFTSELEKNSKKLEKPTTKNDLGVDAVSRKAVLNQIFYSSDNSGDVVLSSALRERIERLPSVTPQEPRWIPVSERYPKIEDEYKYFLVTDDKGKVSVQEFFISLDEEPQPYFSGMVNVIAWMPLPKPYKPQESEE